MTHLYLNWGCDEDMTLKSSEAFCKKKKFPHVVTLFFDVGGHSSEKLLGNCALFSGNLVTNARRLRCCEASKSGSTSV